nr:hypothetical protein [Rhodococcus sp. (in: high G+C Gram-positive bacteria)]
MANTAINDHPLIGTEHVFRADQPPYDPAEDNEPGHLVIGNGHHVTIRSVFHNWNAVEGLTMFYIRCHETGEHTHVTPDDLGISDEV